MPTKTLAAEVDGRRVVLVNTWFSGEWLEVDGVVVAKSRRFSNTDETRPLVAASVAGASGAVLFIEGFIAAVATTRMMIAVNGVRVAGDILTVQEKAALERQRERELQRVRLEKTAAAGGGGASVAVPIVVRDVDER